MKTDSESFSSDSKEDFTFLGYRKIKRNEKVTYVRHFFTKVAQKYDLMNTVLSFGIHHYWKRMAIRLLAITPGNRILDLCGGTGDLSILVAKSTGFKKPVVLCDINREMIEAGISKSHLMDIRNHILYVQGDAEQLPFKDNVFDGVTVGFGIRNLTNIQKGLCEIFRVLTQGGKFMCLEFSQPIHPIFRYLYDKYSFKLIPMIGAWLAGSQDAYAYLTESIRLFPNPEEFKSMMEYAGFADVFYKRLTNGIVTVHIGKKII